MIKRFLNELIIVLLLFAACVLLMGILLYEYVPATKTIPNEVAYSTPEDVKEELRQTEDLYKDDVIMTYKIDSDDLNNYKRVEDYKPGKANPFSSYLVPETSTDPKNPGGNTGNPGNTANPGNTVSPGGSFFKDKGTK